MEAITKQKKSWIEELDNSYNQAVDSAIKALKSNTPKTTIKTETVVEKVNVAGFEVEIKKKVKKKPVKARKLLTRQKNEMEMFRQSLKNKGLEPLAVIPKKVFKKMIEGLPFYTFKNINENGEVKADINTAGEKRELLDEDKVARYFIFSAIAFFAIGVGLAIRNSLFFLTMPVSFVSLIIYVAYYDGEVEEDKIKRAITAILISLSSPIFGLTHILPKVFFFDAKKYLWPDRTDETIIGRNRIKIILPKISKEMNDRLAICHKEGIKTYLVVHEKGFGVSSDEISQKYQRNYDPLVVTDSDDGKYIAVIAQIGKIPEEKKLIEKIKKEFKSLPEELEKLVFLN